MFGFKSILFFVSAFAIADAGNRNKEIVPVSEETVAIAVQKPGLECYDKMPDLGFGPTPGRLRLGEKAMFDRTLRMQGVGGLRVNLPDSVSCADLKEQISKLSQSLSVIRTLEKEIKDTWNKKRRTSQLVISFSAELPIEVEGKNVTLTGTFRWLEENGAFDDASVGHKQLPLDSSFVVRTHPQAAAKSVGLHCTPRYPNGPKKCALLRQLEWP